jgi:hypothetical protein
MPRPLTQKTCGFCAKSYTTRVDKKMGCLCPNCAEDRGVMKYHVDFRQSFRVKITNILYRPQYLGGYGGTSLGVGTLIGYTSKATDIFFIGRVKHRGLTGLKVSPIQRLGEALDCNIHDVPYDSVRCIFTLHG